MIFMIRCIYYKKIIICGNISLVIALSANIFIVYIVLNPISVFLRQFYPRDVANFASSTIIFFFIATLIIWWFDSVKLLDYRDRPGCSSSWFIDNRTWWYLFSSPSSSKKISWTYFTVTNLWVPFSLRHLHFLEEIVIGSFLKISSRFNG